MFLSFASSIVWLQSIDGRLLYGMRISYTMCVRVNLFDDTFFAHSFIHSFVHSFVRFLFHNKLEYILAFKEFHMRLPHSCVIRYQYHGHTQLICQISKRKYIDCMQWSVKSTPHHPKKSHKLGICFQVRSLSTRSTHITLHYITQTQCLLFFFSSALLS